MAGNTVTIKGQLQPSQGYDINYIEWEFQIKQPIAGATSNPSGRLIIKVSHDVQGSGGDGTQPVRASIQIADPTDPHDHDGLAYNCPTVTASSQTFDTGWQTLQINHTTGYDTFTAYASCTGASQVTKSASGKIYWTDSGGGGGGTTTYTIYYQSDGTTIDTQTVNAGSSFALRACGITKSGYTFNGWTNGGRTYGVGYTFTPTGNMWFAASWVETDNTSTSQYISITTENSSDKLYASTSSILGTSVTYHHYSGENGVGGNGTNQLRVYCTHDGAVLAPTKIELLPDSNGNKFANSFVIKIQWGTGGIQQEIVFGCSDSSINGANWVTSHGITLSPSNNDTNPSSIVVSRYNTTGSRGNTVTRVTLNDYWIANVGLSSGTSDTTVGSSQNPAIWYWHYKNLYNKEMDDSDFDWNYYNNTVKPKITRKISWNAPSSGSPLYYVIMYWKGYAYPDYPYERTSDKLGYVAVVDSLSNSFIDPDGWWGGSNAGAQIKIVVHAVYTGGPSPSFALGEENAYHTSSTGLTQNAIEDYAIWWQWGTPPSLYNVKFYEQDKSTVLTDSSGNAYNYYAPTDSAIDAPAEVKIGGVDQTEAYIINGYYKKVGTGSWGTTALTDLGSVGTSDLSFAQSITKRTYRVVYNTSPSATSHQTFEHGTTIYINNDNGTSTVSYVVKENYTIPIPSKTDYVFNGFTYNASTKTFTAQWVAAARYIWIYTGTEWKKGIPWVYDGGWKKGKSAFVYSGGWKEEK